MAFGFPWDRDPPLPPGGLNEFYQSFSGRLQMSGSVQATYFGSSFAEVPTVPVPTALPLLLHIFQVLDHGR